MREKTVVVILGPRGVGKSFVGELLTEELGIPFCQVEPFFLEATHNGEVQTDEAYIRAWSLVENALEMQLKNSKTVSFESVGTYKPFHTFMDSLQEKYRVLVMRIDAPLECCAERYNTRDTAAHVPMTTEQLTEVNKRSREETERYHPDVVLENGVDTAYNDMQKDIMTKFRPLL